MEQTGRPAWGETKRARQSRPSLQLSNHAHIYGWLLYRCAKCERCEVPLDQATFAPPDKQGVLLCKVRMLFVPLLCCYVCCMHGLQSVKASCAVCVRRVPPQNSPGARGPRLCVCLQHNRRLVVRWFLPLTNHRRPPQTHYLEREQAGKAADKCKNTQTKKQSFLLRSPRLQQQTPAPVAAAAVRPAPESPVRPAVALAEQEEEQPTAVVEVVAAEAEPAGVSLLLEGRAEEGKGLEEEEKELDCAKEVSFVFECVCMLCDGRGEAGRSRGSIPRVYILIYVRMRTHVFRRYRGRSHWRSRRRERHRHRRMR